MDPMRRSLRSLVVSFMALTAACAGEDGASATSTSATTSTSTSTTTTSTTADETAAQTTAAPLCEDAVSDLYERRIAPILASDRPKTCNTCHLAGVDLQLFLQETPCQTMACLDARGLVDLDDPGASVILQWILRADPASPLIDQAIIDEEHAAFLAWIEASAACGLCYDGDEPCGGAIAAGCPGDDPEGHPYEDPGGCEPATREALFRHRVYAWRDRCYPCHFDDKSVEAPKWIATGPCAVASLTTMHNVFERGLVDLEDPAASLLLRKPLAEGAGGVMHGGHDKFADPSDPAYVDFLSWIEREAACAAMEMKP